jgi:exonuclease VII small subunit
MPHGEKKIKKIFKKLKKIKKKIKQVWETHGKTIDAKT